MTSALQVLAEIRNAGVEVIADGDLLRFRPADAPQEIRDLLRTHKLAILQVLRGNGAEPTRRPCALVLAEAFSRLNAGRTWDADAVARLKTKHAVLWRQIRSAERAIDAAAVTCGDGPADDSFMAAVDEWATLWNRAFAIMGAS